MAATRTPDSIRTSLPTIPPSPEPIADESRLPLEQRQPRGNELEFYERAKSQIGKERWSEAVQNLKRAMEENAEPGYLMDGMFPVKYTPQLLLAEAYANLGDLRLARLYLREATRYRLDPKDVAAVEKKLR